MLRSRIIPSLLLQDGGLVKTVKFSEEKYIGDPINAVRIFNEKEVDELCLFDIGIKGSVTRPDFGLLEKISQEATMPLCYGGGVNSAKDAIKLVKMGYEKVSISSSALADFELIDEIASSIGSQSMVVTLDVKKKPFTGGYSIFTENGSKKNAFNFVEFMQIAEFRGAGEIIINSIDRDGTMAGYDLDLAAVVRDTISVPFSMIGGAASAQDMSELINKVGVVGACAGSAFVFKGSYKAVLISYQKPNL
jgi:cyclase